MENPPPSSPKQPEPKKLKMSTTAAAASDDDGDEVVCPTVATDPTTASEPKQIRYKRRKIAIFFAYCGVGYQGMQKNPGAKTIEGDLEEALFRAGAVPEPDRGNPKRLDWARSARTDKGVSAVGQVVSGRFYVDPPGLAHRLNSTLPPQIRIFGYTRVTPSFSAKKFCDRRRYVYLVPVFALDPTSHPNRESVLASLGSENELAKCLDCSERGRKVVGLMGKRGLHSENALSSHSGISSNNTEAAKSETMVSSLQIGDSPFSDSEKGAPTLKVENETNESIITTQLDISSNAEAQAARLETVVSSEIGGALCSQSVKEEPKFIAENAIGDGLNSEESSLAEMENTVVTEKGKGFCYGKEERARFNGILKHYVGTHNFHNFTTRTKAEDPAAHRFIVSFDAGDTVTVEGIEFVKCEVVGQSFMLHQIRKMIGLAVSVMRNCAPESLLETALQKDVNINVPTAPEVGLYLDECFFTSYNSRWNDSHEEVSMKAYEEEAEDFKMKHIYPHIASMEHKEGVVALWLHSLNYRNYPHLRVVSGNGFADDRNAVAGDGNGIADNGDGGVDDGKHDEVGTKAS